MLHLTNQTVIALTITGVIPALLLICMLLPHLINSPKLPLSKVPFPSGTSAKALSVCTLCLGWDPHDIYKCTSEIFWDRSKMRCHRNEQGRLVSPAGSILCLNWNSCPWLYHHWTWVLPQVLWMWEQESWSSSLPLSTDDMCVSTCEVQCKCSRSFLNWISTIGSIGWCVRWQ